MFANDLRPPMHPAVGEDRRGIHTRRTVCVFKRGPGVGYVWGVVAISVPWVFVVTAFTPEQAKTVEASTPYSRPTPVDWFHC
jgi:hypothetical protein